MLDCMARHCHGSLYGPQGWHTCFRLLENIAVNPGRPVPEVSRQMNTTLRFTIADELFPLMWNIDQGIAGYRTGKGQPNAPTVEKLPKPMGWPLVAASTAALERRKNSAQDPEVNPG